MIENPNRRDVLTKGSALIVASGAVLSASPGKTQEESTEPGFVRFDQARALYPPHSDSSPPFGLDATVFPWINLETLHGVLETQYGAEGADLKLVEAAATDIVGGILQISRQGGDGDIVSTIRSGELSDDIPGKAETLLRFFPVPATDIALAEYMTGSGFIYIEVRYMNMNRKAFFIEHDQNIIVLSPVILPDSESQCSFGVWLEDFISRNLREWRWTSWMY